MKGAVCCSWYTCQFAGQCCIAEDASVEANVSCGAAGAVDGTDPSVVNGDGTFGGTRFCPAGIVASHP